MRSPPLDDVRDDAVARLRAAIRPPDLRPVDRSSAVLGDDRHRHPRPARRPRRVPRARRRPEQPAPVRRRGRRQQPGIRAHGSGVRSVPGPCAASTSRGGASHTPATPGSCVDAATSSSRPTTMCGCRTGWLDLLLDPFRRNDVMAVCGNVQPLELRNEAQLDFERISPLSKGFRRFESRWAHPTQAVAGVPGMGARSDRQRGVPAGRLRRPRGRADGRGARRRACRAASGRTATSSTASCAPGGPSCTSRPPTCGTATVTPPRRWSRRSRTTTPVTSPTSSRRSSATTTRERPPPRPGRCVRRRQPGRVVRRSWAGATGDRSGPAPRHAARPAQLRPLAAPGPARGAQRMTAGGASPAQPAWPGDGPSAVASAGRPSSPRRRSRPAAARRRHGAADPACVAR